MSGGIGLERTAVAGAVATGIGVVVVALHPPTSLSPVAFLGTLALGAGLGVVAVAGFDFVATRIVATDDGPEIGESDARSPDTPGPDARDPDAGGSDAGGPEPEPSGGDVRDGGLAATEELLRGGAGGDRPRDEDTGQDETGTTETGRRFDVDEDDEGFIWGDGDERQDG